MAKSMKRIHKVTITDMEATMTHTSKGELSDLNLTSGQWHYVENASDGGLRQSLGDDNCQGDFAEAIRRELKQRSRTRPSAHSALDKLPDVLPASITREN